MPGLFLVWLVGWCLVGFKRCTFRYKVKSGDIGGSKGCNLFMSHVLLIHEPFDLVMKP